jgi:hypothetical protein
MREDYAEGAQLSAENVRLKAQLEVMVRFSISFSDCYSACKFDPHTRGIGVQI